MKQVARQLTDCDEGFLNGKKYLIMDRDTKFCESVQKLMHDEQIKPIRMLVRTPNMNAHLERFFG